MGFGSCGSSLPHHLILMAAVLMLPVCIGIGAISVLIGSIPRLIVVSIVRLLAIVCLITGIAGWIRISRMIRRRLRLSGRHFV